MSKRKKAAPVELDEHIMLAKSWAERLAELHAGEIWPLYGQKRHAWVRKQLEFLDPTDADVQAVVGWLDGMVPYSPPQPDSPPLGPQLYR